MLRTIIRSLYFLTFLVLSASQLYAKNSTTKKQEDKEITDIAINYLKQLSRGDVNLRKDTALSPFSSKNKKNKITQQIDLISRTRFSEDDQFIPIEHNLSPPFAAVLIRSKNVNTPLNCEIFGITIIKKNKIWKPAPIPSTFKYTAFGYSSKLEKQSKQLETWIRKKKAFHQNNILKKQKKIWASAIEKELNILNLKKLNSEQKVINFINQCRAKNLPAILAAIGGKSQLDTQTSTLPLNEVISAIQIKNRNNLWHLINNPSVLYEIIPNKEKNKINVGFFNPFSSKSTATLQFSAPLDKGNYNVTVPENLISAIHYKKKSLSRHQRWPDKKTKENLKKIPDLIFKHLQKNQNLSDIQTTQKLILSSIEKKDFRAFISLLPQNKKSKFFVKNKTTTLSQLSKTWRNIDQNTAYVKTNFPIIEAKTIATLPISFIKSSKPEAPIILTIWLVKDIDGWHLATKDLISKNSTPLQKKEIQFLEKKNQHFKKGQKEKILQNFFAPLVYLKQTKILTHADDKDTRKLISNYRKKLILKDYTSILSLCASLNENNQEKTIHTLKYAIRGAHDQSPQPKILGITHQGTWTGVSLKTRSKTSSINDFPLYLIINTEKGLRIILDIDLRYALNKGREIINQKSWSRIAQNLSKKDVSDIKLLFSAHNKLVKKSLTLSDKDKKQSE